MKTRREFLKRSLLASIGTCMAGGILASTKSPRNLLLLSGWQTENIGDIAHTPAMLALLQEHLPDAKVTVWNWYGYLPEDKIVMLKHRFPEVSIIQGTLTSEGKASGPELQKAIASADFLLHNSGPFMVGWREAANFKKLTGKPFGVFGISYGGLFGNQELSTLSDAAFVFLRDSVSLQKVKDAGVRSPMIEFTPDAAFAIDVTNDKNAVPFLTANGLEEGKFLCCIPRHRLTPVWLHKHKNRPFDADRHARNEEMKEHDHKPLRGAITEIVRNTNHKILICHEDQVQQQIGKEWLLDKLPGDVKPRVVWLDRHWLPDEAISVYKRSAGFFGLEMHSPIMCIANGIPAIVGRFEEQTSKGYMWRDIGLEDWLFNFDKEEDIERYVPAVLEMATNPEAAKAKAEKAREFTRALHMHSMKHLEKVSQPS
jgi:polysaccharide pyruvyl transferase WcaK-like protein